MRVLLAQPPLQPGPEVTPPLGLCTQASWLQSSDHEIRVLDLDLQGKPASGPPERTCSNFLTRSIADSSYGMPYLPLTLCQSENDHSRCLAVTRPFWEDVTDSKSGGFVVLDNSIVGFGSATAPIREPFLN
jgi:hypothetical protein